MKTQRDRETERWDGCDILGSSAGDDGRVSRVRRRASPVASTRRSDRRSVGRRSDAIDSFVGGRRWRCLTSYAHGLVLPAMRGLSVARAA